MFMYMHVTIVSSLELIVYAYGGGMLLTVTWVIQAVLHCRTTWWERRWPGWTTKTKMEDCTGLLACSQLIYN